MQSEAQPDLGRQGRFENVQQLGCQVMMEAVDAFVFQGLFKRAIGDAQGYTIIKIQKVVKINLD